jgi:hypothetical protein
MRIATTLLGSMFGSSLVSALVSAFVLTACGSTNQMEAEPFPTLQACVDEHDKTESLSVHDSVIVCCLDHPIAGIHPSCGTTQADCITHVRAELDPSVTDTDIQIACTDYISQK